LNLEPFGSQQVADLGDIVCTPFDIHQAINDIQIAVQSHLEGCRYVIALGGDHTIALPMLRAVHDRFGPVAVVHFDAHLDTFSTYFGAEYTHGTPFRRAAEEHLLAVNRSIHVGIRGPLFAPSDITQDTDLGFQLLSTTDVGDRGPLSVAQAIRERVQDSPLYLSVDIDVLDPSHAPGTGTPDAGGLTTRELLAILRLLAGTPIVGADMVEVAPAYDHAEITALAAAHVVYELLALFASRTA
jgi:agmatinase